MVCNIGDNGIILCRRDEDEEALTGEFVSKTLHVTQVALGHDSKEGDHTVYIERDETMYALGTLNKKTCPHMKLDLVLVDEEVVMKHTGGSVVHVTGYEGLSYGAQDSDDEDDPYADLLLEDDGDTDSEDGGSESSEDSEDEEEDSEDEEDDGVPELVGMQNIPSPDDDDSVDIADVSDSDIDMGIESDDDSSGEDSEDGSSESGKDDDGDESISEEFDSDAEIDMSDSDDEEEREDMKKRLKKALMTPQPSKKKQKIDAPATAPSKLSDAKAPANEKEYKKALKNFLKENGPSKLASLGSAVKRPKSVPKLKKFLASNAGEFSYNTSTDVVSLS